MQQHPALAKASWDWGYGDHETALGAASHVGQRAIAELLLDHGAPPTLFSAAMLGQLEVVKAFITATPGLQKIRGPHSLSLMVHAKAGGPAAAAVVAYLESIGDAALPLTDEPLSADERAMLNGRYLFGDRARDSFTVETKPNQVSMVRAGASARFLRHLGRLEFAPPGAPAVRIRFEREGEKIVALTVARPGRRGPRPEGLVWYAPHVGERLASAVLPFERNESVARFLLKSRLATRPTLRHRSHCATEE